MSSTATLVPFPVIPARCALSAPICGTDVSSVARTLPSSQTFPMPSVRAREAVPSCFHTVLADFLGTVRAVVPVVRKAAATRAPFGASGLPADGVAPSTRTRSVSVLLSEYPEATSSVTSNSRWSTRPCEIWPTASIGTAYSWPSTRNRVKPMPSRPDPGTIELICTAFPLPEYVTTSPVSRVTVRVPPPAPGDRAGSANAGAWSAAAGSDPCGKGGGKRCGAGRRPSGPSHSHLVNSCVFRGW